ncbi:Bifunctional NAD(P)H-hydrate repair enzyme Nnr [bacterium HR33]|nr:Bifunctional NAD(P)H-hydrate repair enzyme Nnr [bacterium HR33]
MSWIPVVDAAQAAAWDERARTAGKIPSRVLMEAAGRGVAHVVAREFGDQLAAGAILLAGRGNNGGDGWVAARALKAVGINVWALEASGHGELSDDCAANRALALASGVELLDPDDPWPDAAVLIDALLGTGASGSPRGVIGQLLERARHSSIPAVAVDGPTGLDLSTGQAYDPLPALLTVTFGGLRRGHLLGRRYCGKIVVLDIGFPPPDPAWPEFVDDRWASARLPGFEPEMHKGERGRVLVIGGSAGMAGAALHAASAALEAGSGLVKIAASEPSVAAAQAALPDALTVVSALGPGIEPALGEAIRWADAIVLGPGLGRSKDRGEFVKAVLEEATVPVVVDADALQVGERMLRAGNAPRVLTPHMGEFRACFPELAEIAGEDRFGGAQRAAELMGQNAAVLLKGVPTVVARSGVRTLVVGSGNPALATGGSGDLLAGFIASFLARGLTPEVAAALGAQVLGRAAEVAAARLTVRATRPADVLAALAELWRRWADLPPARPPILLELDPPQVL